MPTLDIVINGRHHVVQCQEGEEQRVRRLASYIDRRVADLVRAQGQIGDTRLLVMAGLLVADELADTQDEIRALKQAVEEATRTAEHKAGEAVDRIAERLEGIASRLESA
jgi:cell division protein ZapA